MRPTVLEINLVNLAYNIRQIKGKLKNGTGIMAVVKASAYGNGINNLLDTFKSEGITKFAVAIPDEGASLRKENKDIDILILNQPNISEIDTIVSNNLCCGVCSWEFAEKLNECAKNENKIVNVHVEIDTGAGRNGVLPEDALDFIEKVKELKHICIEGIFMHFTCAESDKEYSKLQISIFNDVLKRIKEKDIDIKYIHASSSGAMLNFPEAQYNLVRPGILLYGYYPDESDREKINVKPVEKLVSKINFLKKVPAGSGISYDKTFITERESVIGVVPIGYADGYRRAFSNKAEVVIRGCKARVIGKVCMDMIMIDVTDIPDVKINDDVYLFDNEEITVEELAKISGTINYEIISSISNRVPRVYKY